ncbi:phage gp6-like head-tail connector protein [Sphingomonas sp. ABOLF]|uniref:head-tail connector protein n=1 Tax=Sphingomonas sp. ABOLF TaxID=1985879 RepID=UPI000F7F848F|nr:head-tail connector protein [Sphingomonas sp. ABOLF]RSV15191.1 phage gp6-like head-tail connector protein [Sphingomonas sp. ABOLF]
MLLVTIDAAKEHLGLEQDEGEESHLSDLILAAQATVEDVLGRPLLGAEGWPTAADVPANVIHAIKLVLGEFYLSRELAQIDLTVVRVLVGRHIRVSVG